MHLDTDAYIALGGMASILIISVGLLAYVLMKKR
jgi:hypothetical protein